MPSLFPMVFPRALARWALPVCVIVSAQHLLFPQSILRAETDAPRPGTANAPDNDRVTVNFPNTPVAAIIPFYSQLTGKKMILDAGLQGEMLRIIGTRPLTKREAVAFIESSLLLNGYAVLPIDPETVKLIHHSGGKNPRSEGLPVITSARELPEGEQIVNYVMPLLHISPDEATKAFQQVVQLHTYGSITPITNASAIIITENTSTIRSLVNLAEVIDVSPAEIANEMIKLERSDADSIAEIIKQIYEEKEKSASSVVATQPAAQPVQAGRPVIAPMPQPVVQNNVANVNPTAAKVKIIPYRRTNQILVIARPVDIAYIKGLVQKLDQKGDGLNFKKRKLRFIPVSDFLPVAYNALARDTDIQTEGGGDSTGGSKHPRSTSNSPSTDAANRNKDRSSRNNNQGSEGDRNSSSNSGSHSALTDPDQSESPNSMVVGKTLLIADPQSNSLIVSGSTEHVNIIDQLLNEMDVRPQQIYINTLIGQLNLGDQYKVGFDLLKLMDDFTLRQLTPLNTINGVQAVNGTNNTGTLVNAQPGIGGTTNVISGTNGLTGTTGTGTGTDTIINNQIGNPAGVIQVPFNPGNFNFNTLNLYGQIGSLGRYVNLLEQNKKFKVISRPGVYATNNRKAVISSGQRIAVPVSTLSNASGIGTTASVSSSIEYRDVVLKLEVVPLINSDDEVTLRIAQLNDSIVGTQIVSGNSIPTIGTQELVTTVTVKNGSTVVLGGLITESQGKDRRGVPILSRIPVIKYLFGVHEKNIEREELLIFIQPNIVGSHGHLDTPNRVEEGRSAIMQETLDFGNERGVKIPKARRVE